MNIASSRPVTETPYRKIINSKAGKLVRENKVGTGAAVVAATATIAGGVVQSDTFANVARYGIAPAVGAGIGVLGATAVHDAVVNDVGENNLKATGKIIAGSAATLGGTQIVGAALDIPVLDEAFTGIIFDHGQSLIGGGLVAGAAIGAKAAAEQFKKVGSADNKAIPMAIGTGAAAASVGAGLAGAELIGNDLGIPVMNKALTGTIEFLSQSPISSVVGGGLLTAGAAVAGMEAAKNLQGDKNHYGTAALASGAVAGGLGGIEMMGHGLGLEATQGLFTHNADIVGSLSVSAFGGALSGHAAKAIKEKGLSPTRALMLTAGAGTTVGGLGLAAFSADAAKVADFLGNGTAVVAGAGLGLSSYAFGEKAYQAAKNGKFGNAAFHGTGALASAAGGLAAVGEGLGIEALQDAGRAVARHTVEPIFEHIVSPTLQFFFDNPVVGGIGLAAAVGAFAYTNMKND